MRRPSTLPLRSPFGGLLLVIASLLSGSPAT